MASFSLFLSFLQTFNSKYVKLKLLIIGFDPRSSGIGSNHAVNCAKTTALLSFLLGCILNPQRRLKLGLKYLPINIPSISVLTSTRVGILQFDYAPYSTYLLTVSVFCLTT